MTTALTKHAMYLMRNRPTERIVDVVFGGGWNSLIAFCIIDLLELFENVTGVYSL